MLESWFPYLFDILPLSLLLPKALPGVLPYIDAFRRIVRRSCSSYPLCYAQPSDLRLAETIASSMVPSMVLAQTLASSWSLVNVQSLSRSSEVSQVVVDWNDKLEMVRCYSLMSWVMQDSRRRSSSVLGSLSLQTCCRHWMLKIQRSGLYWTHAGVDETTWCVCLGVVLISAR